MINVDKNVAYPKAFAEVKAQGHIAESSELRHAKYLNNRVEQDHRFIKRLTRPGMDFSSFQTAWRTLQGDEVMNMMRKGHLRGGKGEVSGQGTLVARLFGPVAYTETRGDFWLLLISFLFLQHNPNDGCQWKAYHFPLLKVILVFLNNHQKVL